MDLINSQGLKTALRRLVLRAFNRAFSSNVKMEDIETVRVAAKENLHFGEDHVDSIRLLVNEGLRFGEDAVPSIRLLVREGLKFREDAVPSIRLLVREGLYFREKDVRFIRLLLNDGLHITADELTDTGVKDVKAVAQLCYSQEGESLILDRLFDSQDTGFYVDIGAHHPKRFSNTYALYKRGWRGINIDPTPGLRELFKAARPEDVFMEAAVLSTEDAHNFYMFAEPALNTFSKDLAEEYQQAGYKLAEVRPIKPRKLSSVLEECKVGQPIDLMSIDVEGHELDVLQSNDWQEYRPRVLLVEIIDFDLSRPEASPVHTFLLERGYALFAKTYNTVFYKDARVPEGAA